MRIIRSYRRSFLPHANELHTVPFVKTSGDAMTGPLVILEPANTNEAASKNYVDTKVSEIGAHGNHSGDVTSVGMVTSIANNAVTEQKIADGAVSASKLSTSYLPLSGGNINGNLSIESVGELSGNLSVENMILGNSVWADYLASLGIYSIDEDPLVFSGWFQLSGYLGVNDDSIINVAAGGYIEIEEGGYLLVPEPVYDNEAASKSYVDTGLSEKSDVTHNHDTIYAKAPASHSADYMPQWDGANTRLLKNGVALNSLVQTAGDQSVGGVKILGDIAKYNADKSFTTDQDIVSKKYVDDVATRYSFVRGFFQGEDFRFDTVGNAPSGWSINAGHTVTVHSGIEGHKHILHFSSASSANVNSSMSINDSTDEGAIEFYVRAGQTNKAFGFGLYGSSTYMIYQLFRSDGYLQYTDSSGVNWVYNVTQYSANTWYHVKFTYKLSTSKYSCVWTNTKTGENLLTLTDYTFYGPSTSTTVVSFILRSNTTGSQDFYFDAFDRQGLPGYFTNRNHPYLLEWLRSEVS